MLFSNNKNINKEEISINIDNKKMYLIVYTQQKGNICEGNIYDWQLDVLMKMKYIMLDDYKEYKINKILFQPSPYTAETNVIYVDVDCINNF